MVGEVGAGHSRRRALSGEVVLDPHLATARAEPSGDPVQLRIAADRGVMRGEMPGALGQVLDGDVLDLGAVLDHDLDGGVRVGGELRHCRRVLLDHGEPALRLGDDQQPPEQRATLDRVGDPDVERLVDDDALGHVDEQAVLPHRRVVGRELLAVADERPEQRMVVREQLEADALGRVLDRDPVLADEGDAGGVDLEHRGRRRAGARCAGGRRVASGSNPARSVKRQCSSDFVGSGIAL